MAHSVFLKGTTPAGGVRCSERQEKQRRSPSCKGIEEERKDRQREMTNDGEHREAGGADLGDLGIGICGKGEERAEKKRERARMGRGKRKGEMGLTC